MRVHPFSRPYTFDFKIILNLCRINELTATNIMHTHIYVLAAHTVKAVAHLHEY